MHRSLFVAAMAVLLIAAAGCQGAATPSPTPTAVPTPAPTRPTSTTPPSEGACYAIPPVSDSDWVRGPADAPITLIEYAEFQ